MIRLVLTLVLCVLALFVALLSIGATATAGPLSGGLALLSALAIFVIANPFRLRDRLRIPRGRGVTATLAGAAGVLFVSAALVSP
ncbi:MAG: hypothetical protein M3O34_04620, partial [Chloroflexota bacterium]|nr:hypothetical protein [Chloroflexota bacterium]